MSGYAVKHLGDTGLVVEFGAVVDRTLSAQVLSLARELESRTIAGVLAIVPTFRSLFLQFDPLVMDFEALTLEVSHAVAAAPQALQTPGALWRMPVCFDPSIAFDVDDVAATVGLSRAGLVEAMAAPVYHAYMIGFLPGQPYLGDLPSEFDLPRRQNPRTMVPAGSVGVATRLVCVYPDETPCGWHIVGRTPVSLWREGRAMLAAGDRIRFEPVGLSVFEDLVTRRPPPERVLEPA